MGFRLEVGVLSLEGGDFRLLYELEYSEHRTVDIPRHLSLLSSPPPSAACPSTPPHPRSLLGGLPADPQFSSIAQSRLQAPSLTAYSPYPIPQS